jgi:hypothetical protein
MSKYSSNKYAAAKPLYTPTLPMWDCELENETNNEVGETQSELPLQDNTCKES